MNQHLILNESIKSFDLNNICNRYILFLIYLYILFLIYKVDSKLQASSRISEDKCLRLLLFTLILNFLIFSLAIKETLLVSFNPVLLFKIKATVNKVRLG
jgi:hypothetical protein